MIETPAACPVCQCFPCQCSHWPPNPEVGRVVDLPASGWTCPKCSRVWAPHVDECRACNPPVTITIGGAG